MNRATLEDARRTIAHLEGVISLRKDRRDEEVARLSKQLDRYKEMSKMLSPEGPYEEDLYSS
jgi:hypothetical protein